MPNIPTLGGVPTMNKVPGLPNTSGIPNIPTLNKIPGIPSTSGIPAVGQTPAIPFGGSQNTPVLHTFMAQATKKARNFGVKLKGLNWNRIWREPKEKPNRNKTIWDSIEEFNDLEDLEIVEEFKQADSDKPVLKSVKLEVAPKRKTILDGKRSQAVGIALSKLPKIADLTNALINFDLNILTDSVVSSLNKSSHINSLSHFRRN